MPSFPDGWGGFNGYKNLDYADDADALHQVLASGQMTMDLEKKGSRVELNSNYE